MHRVSNMNYKMYKGQKTWEVFRNRPVFFSHYSLSKPDTRELWNILL